VATRFIPNPLGIALIARTPFMANAMLERADAVAETAKEIAPEGPGRDGHYRDMIDTAPIVALGVAGGRVNAWKFTAVFLEFGTSDTPTFATLRTSCDANGLALTGGRQS
jgi:hypothetical protein